MNWELNLAILLAGVATFLLRWLPLRQNPGKHRTLPEAATRILAGIGPAAITALLTLSLAGLVSFPPDRRALAVATALVFIVICKRVTGGIVVPTLAGALVYGLVAAF